MRITTITGLTAIIASAASAQSAKRVITPDAYDGWKSIAGAALSDDGKWAAYTIVPQVGEGEPVVRSTSGPREFRANRGFLARPVTEPSSRTFRQTPPALFSADSRFVVFSIDPPRADVERARREKTKPADQPKGSLGILRLADGNVTRVARVASFKMPRDVAGYVTYLLEPDSGVAPDTSARAKKKPLGTTLVLRELATGTETRIGDVVSYVFDDSARVLAYAVSSRSSSTDGVYRRSLADGSVTPLLVGEGNYKQLVTDRRGTQVAFLSDRDEFTRPKSRYALYHAGAGTTRADVVVGSNAAGQDMIVSPNGTVRFTRDGSTVLFGIAPAPPDSIPADSLADKAVFDLWHWKDPTLQPAQRVTATQDRDRSYTAVYQVATRRWLALGTDSLPDVRVSEDGRSALGIMVAPYRVQEMWGDVLSDLYVFDVASGKRTLVRARLEAPTGSPGSAAVSTSLSPTGKYVLYFEGRDWKSFDVASGRTVDLTGPLRPTHFEDETDDHPAAPGPWGIGGWTRGDARVLIYDRYDVWEIDPTGATPGRNLTDGAGRKSGTTFRVAAFHRQDENGIDPAQPVYLMAQDQETMATGIWRDQIGAPGAPVRLLMADKGIALAGKAKKADQFLVTQQSFREFPDLWVGPKLDKLTRISDANPQQSEFRWGTSSLVRWQSASGVPLKGVLRKPDGFDPSKKYPMIVYFYEMRSQALHQYEAPQPNSANITPITYVSKGYLVFEPDIVYTVGHPGQSALNSIVPGVKALIDSGFVDAGRVGIQGHSWGGYQAAYMITQTNMFRAANAGAIVANMISAYGGIRWGSGLNRAWQYEKSQSRIGVPPWDAPHLYVENSPIFHVAKVSTPLLMMHDDNDGAVPWYQGIEMFVALRRLGKEVYMFNYNGDDHGLMKRANAMDWDMRSQQFFDYYLMDAPLPSWMKDGIPYLKKGRDQIAPPKVVP